MRRIRDIGWLQPFDHVEKVVNQRLIAQDTVLQMLKVQPHAFHLSHCLQAEQVI